MEGRQADSIAHSAESLGGWGQDLTHALDALAARREELTRANAEVQREALAQYLGIDQRKVKPCVACIGAVEQGQREQYAYVLAIELVKAGVPADSVVGYLGYYAKHCDQPPIADQKFPASEAIAQGRKVLRMRERRERIRGFGCKKGPLLRFCPYGAPAGRDRRPRGDGERRPTASRAPRLVFVGEGEATP